MCTSKGEEKMNIKLICSHSKEHKNCPFYCPHARPHKQRSTHGGSCGTADLMCATHGHEEGKRCVPVEEVELDLQSV